MRQPGLTTAIVLFALSSAAIFAQTPDSKSATPQKTTSAKKSGTTETNSQERLRRSQARSLLMTLSTDARTFSDPVLRARSLGRIADALWQVDEEQARLMFRKSWEAAEVADQENDRKQQEEIQRQTAQTGGGYVINTPPQIRREV